jgi:hypothetical protein
MGTEKVSSSSRNESDEPGTWTDPCQTPGPWQVKCTAMVRERRW